VVRKNHVGASWTLLWQGLADLCDPVTDAKILQPIDALWDPSRPPARLLDADPTPSSAPASSSSGESFSSKTIDVLYLAIAASSRVLGQTPDKEAERAKNRHGKAMSMRLDDMKVPYFRNGQRPPGFRGEESFIKSERISR
jgi:hypothetical protein